MDTTNTQLLLLRKKKLLSKLSGIKTAIENAREMYNDVIELLYCDVINDYPKGLNDIYWNDFPALKEEVKKLDEKISRLIKVTSRA